MPGSILDAQQMLAEEINTLISNHWGDVTFDPYFDSEVLKIP